jgi:hypothetical protein
LLTQLIFLGGQNVTDTNVEKTGAWWTDWDFLEKACQAAWDLVR